VIRRSALLASTGLAVRDEALRQALSTLVQQSSREGVVQPVAILLLPRTDGVAEVCAPAANDF